jgi:hypothetical protein
MSFYLDFPSVTLFYLTGLLASFSLSVFFFPIIALIFNHFFRGVAERLPVCLVLSGQSNCTCFREQDPIPSGNIYCALLQEKAIGNHFS